MLVTWGSMFYYHLKNNLPGPGLSLCQCRSRVVGSVASELLLGPVFESKALTSKLGNGVGCG